MNEGVKKNGRMCLLGTQRPWSKGSCKPLINISLKSDCHWITEFNSV